MGHVGLVDATAICEAGFRVIGFDINADKVESLNRGKSTVNDISDDRLSSLVDSGRFEAHADSDCLSLGDVFIIAVPTLLTKQKDPDVTAVNAAFGHLAARIRPPALVVLESTCYPGATEELGPPAMKAAGLSLNNDYWLAFSPARIDPGNDDWPMTRIPKIVSGVTPESLELARAFYERIMETVIAAQSTSAAEMTKLLENSYRLVNIAFIEQMSEICHELGLDIWEIIKLASTKPFGFTPFYPGPGPGGTCIPIDPFYVAWKAREHERHAGFIEMAGEVIDGIPHVLLDRLFDMLNKAGKPIAGARVLMLGVSYKKDTLDLAGSPARPLIKLLEDRGAAVSYHDPLFPDLTVSGRRHRSVALTREALKKQDAVILMTDHSEVDYRLVVANSPLILDTRHRLAQFNAPNVHAA